MSCKVGLIADDHICNVSSRGYNLQSYFHSALLGVTARLSKSLDVLRQSDYDYVPSERFLGMSILAHECQ